MLDKESNPTRKSKRNLKSDNLSRLTAILIGLPWVEMVTEAWKFVRKIFRGLSNEGMYEVLEYSSILELHDKAGKKASFKKRKKVRYLQDNIIAYQDYGWGDGKFLQKYRSSPAVPVDQYKAGYKTYVLLSLREVKNRGDVNEFFIQWEIENGFLKPNGFWDTDVSNRTKQMKVSVIFPKNRPPQKVKLEQTNARRTQLLSNSGKKKLPDGRWRVSWEIKKPRLYEHYVLRWDW
jgi:hypothetical protein